MRAQKRTLQASVPVGSLPDCLRMVLGKQIKFVRSDTGHGGASASEAVIMAGVEPESMDARGIFGVVLAVAVLVVVIVIAVFQIVNLEVQDVRRQAAAASTGTGALTELSLEATRKLNRYEPIVGSEGRYRIPIDRAMELMAKESYARSDPDYSPEVVLLPEQQ